MNETHRESIERIFKEKGRKMHWDEINKHDNGVQYQLNVEMGNRLSLKIYFHKDGSLDDIYEGRFF